MNTETELNAADLALYIGCEAQTPVGRGKIVGFWLHSGNESVCVHIDGFNQYMPPCDVAPILRPLSDMAEDEQKEFVPLCAGSQIYRFTPQKGFYKNGLEWLVEFDNSDVDRLIMNESGETWFASYFQHDDERRNWSNTVNQHQQTIWLLAHHFDLFGWIDAGLAIDKTKTENP